jgi:asparagine synthase (glutamine-hydrolysing)
LVFASEIKSIFELPEVPRRLNSAALPEYLALGYVPAPLTLFEGIEKVLPGHMLVRERGQIRDLQYWEVQFDKTETHSEAEWIEKIREQFLEAVKLRMIRPASMQILDRLLENHSARVEEQTAVKSSGRACPEPVESQLR